MDAKIEISKHARQRMHERLGLKKRSIERIVEKAFDQGVTHAEATGRFKKYFAYLFLEHQDKHCNNIRVWQDKVFIFNSYSLITVIPLPNAHKNAAKKIQNRKVNGNESR